MNGRRNKVECPRPRLSVAPVSLALVSLGYEVPFSAQVIDRDDDPLASYPAILQNLAQAGL